MDTPISGLGDTLQYADEAMDAYGPRNGSVQDSKVYASQGTNALAPQVRARNS